MNKQQKWILITTFIMGIVSGAYLYLIGFAPALNELEDSLRGEADFTITGEVYGGCRSRCPAFFLQSDRSLRILNAGEDTSEPAEITLSAPVMDNLIDALTAQAVLSQSKAVEPLSCPSYSDGVDYHYEIRAGEELYQLDTCGTDFAPGTELGQALQAVWNEIAHGAVE